MTNRRIARPSDLDALTFDSDGLIPVVTQDSVTGAVLMVAWANAEAVNATLATDEVHFYSRSRARLWRKGEESGNVLRLVSLHADCDGDTLLALVEPAGPACHTGEVTCFGFGAQPGGTDAPEAPLGVLEFLEATMRERRETRPDGSYTVRLLDDTNLRLKKLGEEVVELVAALATKDRESIPEESADLLYHLIVAILAEDVGLDEVLQVLDKRSR